jgi:hypothetical protein
VVHGGKCSTCAAQERSQVREREAEAQRQLDEYRELRHQHEIAEQQLEEERRQQYRTLLNQIATGKDPPSDKLLMQLGDLGRRLHVDPQERERWHDEALEKCATILIVDEIFDSSDDLRLGTLATALKVPMGEWLARHKELGTRIMVARFNAGVFPVRAQPKLLAQKGEIVHWEVEAKLLKEVVDREFRGGYSGASFRVAKGVRFHVGGTRGHSVVTGSHIEVEDTGVLSVSSRRAVFIGQRESVEMLFSKLVSVEAFADGIRFSVSNRKAASTLQAPNGELVAGLVSALVEHQGEAQRGARTS